MSWLRKVSPGDYLTLLNGVLGFLAITYIIDERPQEAMLLILMAIFVDGADGYVARRLGSRHGKGHYLDSFSDTISFCFAPAILMYSMFYEGSRGSAWTDLQNAFTVFASTLIVTFGIVRLARFVEAGHKEPWFIGLPTPANAFFLVQAFLLFGVGGFVSEQPYAVMGLSFVSSFLMVSGVPYPRVSGSLSIGVVAGLVVALAAVLLLLVTAEADVAYALVLVSFSLSIIYIAGGPWYARSRGSGEEVLQLHGG
jgi:CDP-diacylglycerol--serine O-phosphatidyltransferase